MQLSKNTIYPKKIKKDKLKAEINEIENKDQMRSTKPREKVT